MFNFFAKKKSLFVPLASEEALRIALDRSEKQPVLLFKHSSTCGVSAIARRRLNDLSEPFDPPVYELVVQRSRSLSNHIAAMFGILHQSPQVILVYRGDAIFDTSHGGVSSGAIRKAIQTAGITQSEIL